MISSTKPILVIGGGIGGMTAAVEAAEVGYRVILVEKEAYLGGRVMRMYRYFPKMCPPACGFEINTRRIRQNPGIDVYTLATVKEITGKPGNFRARIRIKPRYVTGAHPLDESIMKKLSSERSDDFNYGISSTKALYLPHDMAYPSVHVLDREALNDNDARFLKENTPAGTIDFEMKDEEVEFDVSAIIMATGWHPYEAEKLDNLGYGKFPNVITNVMMERYAAQNGPTAGEIVRPSDGKKPENVAFVQCAGSRDENHLPYCSAVCCMASLKQVRYLREKYDNSKATVFYIDLRTVGMLENFYFDMLDDTNVSFIKGKVGEINEESGSNDLILDVEDTISSEILHQKADLVVLATGMVPNRTEFKIPFELKYDEYGFIDESAGIDGIYAVGCARHPCDVSRTTKDSTAAALKAIQCLKRGV